MDVCSVHSDATFLRYSVSLLGYGFYGDVLANSERNRWMGPLRYDLAGEICFPLPYHRAALTCSSPPGSKVKGSAHRQRRKENVFLEAL